MTRRAQSNASLVAFHRPVRQATPPTGGRKPQSGAFYSPEAFVDAWVSPRPKADPIPRDFTFKAVIGEPSW